MLCDARRVIGTTFKILELELENDKLKNKEKTTSLEPLTYQPLHLHKGPLRTLPESLPHNPIQAILAVHLKPRFQIDLGRTHVHTQTYR